MKTATYNNWHAWTGNGGVLLSNEETKNLQCFPDWDTLTHWLLVNGQRDAARSINAQVKNKGEAY